MDKQTKLTVKPCDFTEGDTSMQIVDESGALVAMVAGLGDRARADAEILAAAPELAKIGHWLYGWLRMLCEVHGIDEADTVARMKSGGATAREMSLGQCLGDFRALLQRIGLDK